MQFKNGLSSAEYSSIFCLNRNCGKNGKNVPADRNYDIIPDSFGAGMLLYGFIFWIIVKTVQNFTLI